MTKKEGEETQPSTRRCPRVGTASWSRTLSLAASPKIYNVHNMVAPVGRPTHHHTQQDSADLVQIL